MRLKTISILISTLLPAFAACSREAKVGGSKTTAIIGVNTLTPESDHLLRSTVGMLTLGDSACTGFVTAPNEITTAAHCILGAGAKDLSAAIFSTASGVETKIQAVVAVDVKKDYLKLATTGTFGSSLQFADLQPGAVSFAGFDVAKKQLFSDENCAVTSRDETAGAFFHSCSTLSGMSGGPVLQDGKVVGIHLGYKADLNQNVALDVAHINDKDVDLTYLGIKDECGFGCGGNWTIPTHPNNPINGGTIGGAIGTVIGIPVVGAAVGALIGDHNLAQQKIAELRAQNQQQAADLLQAKVDRQNDADNAANAAKAAANSITCLRGRDAANSYILGALASALQTFNSCLSNATDTNACQSCLDSFNDTSNKQIGLAKQVFGCQ